MIAAVMRPVVMPYANRLMQLPRMLGYRMNSHGDTAHFGVTTKQHRVITGIASLFFIAGSALWGLDGWETTHELASKEVLAPFFTGTGSLVTLINAIIPVDHWQGRMQQRKARRTAERDAKNN